MIQFKHTLKQFTHNLAQFTHCSQAMTEFTHTDIVDPHFGTVHTLFTSYNTL